MEIKTISVALTKEEREALYAASARECRRPPDQIRFFLREALGITNDQPMESIEQTQNAAGGLIRQDLATSSVL